MKTEAPLGQARPGFRYRKRVLVGMILLPLLGLIFSNLLLTSPWARHWMAGEISKKTGLEATIRSASWSPWSGLTINQFKLYQPTALRGLITNPLVEIASLNITPVWRAWLRGEFTIRSISLDSPHLTLPGELLAHLAQVPQPILPAPAAPPQAVAAAPPPHVSAPPQVARNPPASPPSPATVQPVVPSAPTSWIHLKNASITLLSPTHRRPIFAAIAMNGSLPIAGDSAQSELKIGNISCAGQTLAADLPANFAWKFPTLTLEPLTFNVAQMKASVTLQIAILGNLPLQIKAEIPNHPLPEIRLPHAGITRAESFAANAAFRGLLLSPTTWQGDFIAQAIAPTMTFGSHEAKFDRGSAITTLRSGRLSCLDARLIGDELSVLANATLLANGTTAAACRLVATPEMLGGIVTTIFPKTPPPALTPLSTPQRAAFDLAAFGNIGQLYIQLGKDGPIINLISPPAQP